MRYLCVHCDHRFEEEGEKKPRCPKCMRVHGIEVVGKGDSDAGTPSKLPWLLGGVAILAVVGIAAGYFVWSRKTPDMVGDTVPLRPLEPSELSGHVRRLQAEAGELAAFLEADDAVSDWAEEVAKGDGPAAALTAALRARASKRGFVDWSLSAPRDEPLRLPQEVLTRIERDGANERLYPLEAAGLAVAGLRSVGVPAMVAEVYSFPGAKQPPDPSGHFGYFVVAVYPGEPGEGTPSFHDPFGGRTSAPAEGQFRVLNDVQVLAAAINHRAIHQMINAGDTAEGFKLSEQALKLDRRSPTIRSVRGAIAILSGGADEGMSEFEAAAQLRPDGPRLNNLAGLALAQGDLDSASRDVAKALELHEDYAGARTTLAAIHLSQGEVERARVELDAAERVDPELPNLPMMWANYYLKTHEPERAGEKAMEAIERRQNDWQTRLSAARILRATGQYEEMRRQAQKILELVPAARAEQVRALIEQVLGPTAFEEVEQEVPEEEEGSLPSPEFQLQEGTGLLTAGGGDGPSLLGGDEGADGPSLGAEPMLQLGDPSNLRLHDPGEALQLDLGE